ncbi:flavin reductase [Gemmatimonadetes bacterium T265]|nr:flavin reductase [Gemmatimonadetes bacterium T265]
MPSPSPDDFRATLGRFATGVTVVTATAGGRDYGMTVSAFASLSLDPPMVLVCVDRAATMHGVLADDSVFAVNMLAAGQEALSRRFASGDPTDRFAGVGYTRGALGAPLLDGTLAWLECRVEARHAGGDHSIVVGAVAEVGVREARPLLYYRSGYASLER